MHGSTLTTKEVAAWLQINTRSVARWARGHGIHPRRVRVGRSFVSLWSRAELIEATRPITDGS